MKYLLWTDCETGGRDPRKHALLSLAYLPTDLWGDPLPEFGDQPREFRFNPDGEVTPGAAKVNGYDPATWRATHSLPEALREYHDWCNRAILAGNSVSFDRDFLRVGFRRADLPDPWDGSNYHIVDVGTLAFPLLQLGRIDKISLRRVAEAVGVPFPVDKVHNASDDVLLTLAVFRRLLPRELTVFVPAGTDIKIEEFLRSNPHSTLVPILPVDEKDPLP